jgi:hypothetical protein
MEIASTIDGESLMEFVTGTLPTADLFPITARPLMRKFARSAAPELPPDLRDEVVSQSLEFLIEHGKQFQPSRGSAKAFLKVITAQAARKVRADYRAPGVRSRPKREEWRHRPGVDPIHTVDVPDPRSVDDLDNACEVRAILRCAPRKIAHALLLIYFAGEAVGAAARRVGMSRFSLSREMGRFMQAVREERAA